MQSAAPAHVGLTARGPGEQAFGTRPIWVRPLVALLLLAGLLFGLSSCADTNLVCSSANCQQLQAASTLNNKVEVKGQYCTANPNSVGFLYRVLFIVDVSGSTTQSDPTQQRAPAVQAAIQQYANNPEVSFALMSFSTTPMVLEPTFTRDLGVLLPVIPQFNVSNGGTDYLDTLTTAKNLIATDANTLSVSERARTTYIIQWLSDGVPQPCTDIPSIPAAEQGVLSLVNTYGLLNVTLSTIYLTGDPMANACGTAAGFTPTDVMSSMAAEGGGTFQALSGSQLKFNINVSQVIEPFASRFFYVVNESRVVKNNTLYADSDMDGVSDSDEIASGTDPLNADPNHTGCTDGINAYLAPNNALCAAECAASVTQAGGNVSMLPDTDADTIHDCAETALGSAKLKADSDGDNLIDSLELRFGTNFNDSATLTADTDGDGVRDADEILQGTNPLSPEKDRTLAYVYAPYTAATSTVPGETCFNFDITNVQLAQTMATATTQAGDNRLCLYAEQLPQSTSGASAGPTVTKNCFTANIKDANGTAVITPSSLVTVTPPQFTPVICNSATCQ